MTRSKIQKMKFFLYLLVFLLAEIAACSGTFREKINKRDIAAQQRNEVPFVNDVRQRSAEKDSKIEEQNASLKITPTSLVESSNRTTRTSTQSPKQHWVEGPITTALTNGAVLRGFSVFIGLTVLVLAYIVFRSFRLRKTRAQMIRKYGVLAHRQDVEMRPLPLEEEDDEDTTVFDATNVLTNDVRHQNL